MMWQKIFEKIAVDRNRKGNSEGCMEEFNSCDDGNLENGNVSLEEITKDIFKTYLTSW